MVGHASDDDGAALDIDAYEESYFTLAPDTSKYGHLRREELEVVVSEGTPLPATSVSPIVLFFI